MDAFFDGDMLKYLDEYLDANLGKQIAQTYSIDLSDEGGYVNVRVARVLGAADGRCEQRKLQSTLVRHLLATALEHTMGRECLQHCELRNLHNGKPVLYSSQLSALPAITLSHSHDVLACAWSGKCAVGIDVELVQPRDWEAVQDALLHPIEKAWMREIPAEEQALQYYYLWCLKEAFYKVLPFDEGVVFDEVCFSKEHVLIEAPSIFLPLSGWKTHVHQLASERAVMAVVWRI